MSTLQIRDIQTGKVIKQSKPIDTSLTALSKREISRRFVERHDVNIKDIYITEMVGGVCINKWDFL